MPNSRASAAFEAPTATRSRNSAARELVTTMAFCRCTSLPFLQSQFPHAGARRFLSRLEGESGRSRITRTLVVFCTRPIKWSLAHT
jgi:hypothetical protein